MGRSRKCYPGFTGEAEVREAEWLAIKQQNQSTQVLQQGIYPLCCALRCSNTMMISEATDILTGGGFTPTCKAPFCFVFWALISGF